MLHSAYARAIRPSLPKEAFLPAPRKLIPIAAHLFIVGTLWIMMRLVPATYWPLVSAAIGHSLACLAFLAHEVSHRTVITDKRLLYPLELILWALNLIPATMWKRTHNAAHHGNTNSLRDPDRRFIEGERSLSTLTYALIWYPNRHFRYNILVLFQFVPYIGRHAASVFYPSDQKPSIVPQKGRYTFATKVIIALEIGFILCLQVVIYLFVARSPWAYLWGGPVALLFASAVVMSYVFTNHFLNPLGDGTDPLEATTSVRVPWIFDKLHYHFSYHTEHHLFPGMNSKYYPQVCKALEESFPNRYSRFGITQAWRELWCSSLFLRPDKTRISLLDDRNRVEGAQRTLLR